MRQAQNIFIPYIYIHALYIYIYIYIYIYKILHMFINRTIKRPLKKRDIHEDTVKTELKQNAPVHVIKYKENIVQFQCAPVSKNYFSFLQAASLLFTNSKHPKASFKTSFFLRDKVYTCTFS